MAIINEIQYRLHYTCDGCGKEESYNTAWGPWQGDPAVHLPFGWAHFSSLSAIQIDDVPRIGRALDFCKECVSTKTINFLISKIPFDDRSLKSISPGVYENHAPGK